MSEAEKSDISFSQQMNELANFIREYTPQEFWYEITCIGGSTTYIKARNSQQAKRKACKEWGFKPNDYWTGISSLTAQRVREKDLPWNQGGQANV